MSRGVTPKRAPLVSQASFQLPAARSDTGQGPEKPNLRKNPNDVS
jgi:hypothetical protein